MGSADVALWLLPLVCPSRWLTAPWGPTKVSWPSRMFPDPGYRVCFRNADQLLAFCCESEGGRLPGWPVFTLSAQQVPGTLTFTVACWVGRSLTPLQCGDPGLEREATCCPFHAMRARSAPGPSDLGASSSGSHLTSGKQRLWLSESKPVCGLPRDQGWHSDGEKHP